MFQREEHYQTGISASHFHGLPGLGLPKIVKLLPATHKWIRKQNLQKVTDMASNPLTTPRQALSTRNFLNFAVALRNKKII